VTGKENTVAAGTNTQYYRGDKSWVTLDKVAVGLNNVDNTSDASKPVSTATSTALAGKEPTLAAGTASQYYKGNKTWADFTTDLRASVLTGIVVKTLGETIANFGSMIAGTNNIDLSTGGIITLTVANSGSLAFTNVPALVNGASGNAFGFALITINDGTAGRAMAFPASVKWSGGTIPPRTTTAGAKDEWYFYTLDGGVTWTGSLSNQDVK
jgi:hypothetical protein